MKLFLSLVLTTSAIAAAENQGSAAKPWLGIAIKVMESPTASRFVYIAAVAPDAPGANAGLQAGDIATSINGRPAVFADELAFLEFVAKRQVGEKLDIGVVRAGKKLSTTVVVGALPAEFEQAWKQTFERAKQARTAKQKSNE